jgi:hypothetical protein
MYPDWLKRSNPSSHMLVIAFHKPSKRDVSNKASNSPRFRFNKCFFLSPGHSMQWIPLLPKEGGLIQVDIGGHPPFPTGSKQFSGNFGNLLFLAVLTSGAILRA